MNKLLVFVFIFFLSSHAYCEGGKSTSIKSIKISKSGNDTSYPIIQLGSEETVTLSFDDLSDSPTNYSYSIIHCSSNWKTSGLILNDYQDGFEINTVTDYRNSIGTTTAYTHYSLEIPNSNVKIKISGNYLLKVFDTDNPDQVVIEQRFMVVEPSVTINLNERLPIDPLLISTSQQIELSINTNSLKVSNPYTDLIVDVMQNGELENSLLGVKPTFINGEEIVYSSTNQPLFDGVNEFRSFDINSFRYISLGVKSIDKIGGEYSIQLQPEENNRNKKYFNRPDKNGSYIINLENSEQSDIEADYGWVYFNLPYYDQLQNKEVYVYGELTNWQLSKQNLMQYNYQREAYELRLFLKQGYYNYRYIVRDSKTGEVDQTFFEGNHSETENDYLVLVYYKQPSDRYERLVGVKKINSRNPN